MDSRTRSGFLGLQFDRLADGLGEQRSIVIEADVAHFTLTRYENVVSCTCDLRPSSADGLEALSRRGAVDGIFMISRKLSPRDFGNWLDRLLVEDLGADPDHDVRALELEAVSS